MQPPASGYCRWSSSIWRMSASTVSETAMAGSRRSTRQAAEVALSGHRQRVSAIDHRFALSTPAWVSALSLQSFSSASCPIFACGVFRSGLAVLNRQIRPLLGPAVAASNP
jgi:hypothetical protein